MQIAYCGLDCENCVKFEGKFADMTKEILESIEESGLDGWQRNVESCSKCSKFPCEKVAKFKKEKGVDVVKSFGN